MAREYALVVEMLPARLVPAARALPHQLGITSRPGGGWGDYVTLAPMLDLPRFAAEVACVSMQGSKAFTRAHLRGGFVGLALDRLADGQAAPAAETPALLAALRHAWIDALGCALGDRHAARRRITYALALQRHAMAAERRAWASRELTLEHYAQLVCDKAYWLALAALALLDRHGTPQARHDFLHGYELLMLAMQLMDDALDDGEDQQLRGASVAALLGLEREVLWAAVPLLSARAAERFDAAGSLALGVFAREHGAQCAASSAGPKAWLTQLGGRALCDAAAVVAARRACTRAFAGSSGRGRQASCSSSRTHR